VEIPTIHHHIKRVFDDSKLAKWATIKKHFIVKTEGGREISREIEH
jgi:hypothetical protein